MPIYKPSELRQFLESLQIYPKKGLSQNFLIDGNIINKIKDAAEVCPGDIVLEIGPGPGSLTENLLKAGARVLAVEKDPVLAQALERLQTADNRLEVFCADILDFPIEETLKKHLSSGQKAKVAANLPYHVTTPILIELVTKHHLFSRLVLMVQDEVAKRFSATSGTSAYGSITLFLNFFSSVHYAFPVSNNCFYPVPKVQSAVVAFDLKEPPFVSNQEGFFKVTRTAFGHRRKMLRASLRDLYSSEKVTAALEKAGLNPLARPEDLSLENFIELYRLLNLSQ